MNSSLFDLEAAPVAYALPRPEQEGSRVEGSDIRQLRPSSPAPHLGVQLAVRGTRSASPEWSKLVGSLLERTLQRLLGPEAPQELLLESALFEALSSWPPRGDQTITLWGQRIAVGVAHGYLKSAARSSPEKALPAPSGSLREAITHLHRWLRAARQDEQLAFALLELNASSVAEASAILSVAPAVVRQRAAFLRRQLLFAARGDRLLARYLRLGRRLNGLLRLWNCAVLAPPSQRARRISAEAQLELHWFM
jgi:DNA-directed RNA polymerase specialized sigma24 family protein